MSNLNKLCDELAREIAKVNFETNQQIYREEAEFYANEGVTERTFMRDSDEQVDMHFEDVISPEILKKALKKYKRLVTAKYGK